jgi:hypothetical protein
MAITTFDFPNGSSGMAFLRLRFGLCLGAIAAAFDHELACKRQATPLAARAGTKRIAERARQAIDDYLNVVRKRPGDFLSLAGL